ncbi:DUF475 domain-containing protein [Streptomyces radiopugnans]|uniref:Integral membrane protein, YkoY family n=1 Tax=Streptomyces radiopugnans TaxID=403935 RepID=A0A1H8ZC35_9ACTN|nr:DUF475 domain-containing protein [Streptomyces radiopugnans]SEP61965.1 hypothetical protein SAMN05216481_101444 [Streptomyces radiopugnans]
MVLRTFGWSFGVTAAGLVTAFLFGGWEAFALVGILSILEISLSFDNAVVNAGVLKKMNEFWQKIFLTIGILIAVFGMRLVFPIVIVSVSAQLGPIEAVDLALNDQERYEQLVTDAHPAIAAFGGMFLLMIFLNFLFDEERDVHWLKVIERPLARFGQVEGLAVVVALIALLISGTVLGTHAVLYDGHSDESATVYLAGIAGLLTYLIVNGLSSHFENKIEEDEEQQHEAEEAARRAGKQAPVVLLAGKAAFFMFLYLEVLDASFSFDGVIGAFAITNDPVVIALGLGIGAMYVRSLTVYLVRQGTLDEYRYLEHGAHYAIGALGILLLITIRWHVNEVITGLIGVALIGTAFWTSLRHNRRDALQGGGEGGEGGSPAQKPEVPSGV